MNETILTPKQRNLQAFRNVFDAAFMLTVQSYADKMIVLQHVGEQLRETAVTSIMTPNGLNHATDFAFGDVNNREFIMTLQANFYSLMGEYHQTYLELVEGVAYGLTCDVWGVDIPTPEEYVLVPQEFSEHIFDQKTVCNYLRTNKWLLMYVLMILWARIPSEREIRDYLKNPASIKD